MKREDIETVRAALREWEKALVKEAADARKAAMAATPREWRFELLPATDGWDRSHDPSCVFYVLRGVVTNAEECKKAGYRDDSVSGGSMKYLYNTLSHKLVMPVGGGHNFIGGWGHDKLSPAQELQWEALSKFLQAAPEGGIVTGIVVTEEFKLKWGG